MKCAKWSGNSYRPRREGLPGPGPLAAPAAAAVAPPMLRQPPAPPAGGFTSALFDLDGTLVASEYLNPLAWDEVRPSSSESGNIQPLDPSPSPALPPAETCALLTSGCTTQPRPPGATRAGGYSSHRERAANRPSARVSRRLSSGNRTAHHRPLRHHLAHGCAFSSACQRFSRPCMLWL